MALKVAGTQIARRYQLLNRLGSGGMGVVYRALDRLSGQVVALKQVTIDSNRLLFSSRADRSFDGQDVRLALAHEFKTLASLRHPNIVSVIDYGFDGQRQPFYTMSLLENAQTFCQAGCGQPAEVQYSLLLQLFQALLYLHRRGILHRDLKPSNVVVVSGQVKVLDFGLSVAHDDGGTISGTLAYMAPELLSGQPASEASDLYAVGIIAYELLAGRHPFRTERASELIDDMLHSVPDMTVLRQGDPLVAIIRRLLAKRPEYRYGDTAVALAEFSMATGRHLPIETALTRESFLQAARLVGRDGELARLSQALAETLQGCGGLYLVGGESGIGKSRLLDELRILALVEGVLVLRGQAVSEGGTPYLLWRDALRQLCLFTPLSEFESSVLKALVPDIGVLLGCPVSDAPDLEPQATQDRLISVVTDVCARQSQPMLLILEDAHWAGSESITMLERLGRQISQQRLMIVTSYRSDERPNLPHDLSGAQVLSLERLPPAQIADLSASILGENLGRQTNLTDLLVRETEGNVFFIVEVLRALAEETGQLDRISTTSLPVHVFSGGMRTIVQRRLKRVPEWAQPLLQAAAAVGQQIDPAILRTVEPQTDLDGWLAVCTDTQVLDFRDNQWRFSHDKLREGVLVDLSPECRQDLHGQVALAIEQCYPDDASQAAALAGHWARASNLVKEAHYAGLAGEQAINAGAYEEAIRFLQRADTLAEQVGTALLRRIGLRSLMGTAYYSLGNMSAVLYQLNRTLSLAGFVTPQGQAQTIVGILRSLLQQIKHRLTFDVLKHSQQSNAQSELYGTLSNICEQMTQPLYFSNERYALLYYALGSLNLAEEAGPAYPDQQAVGYSAMMTGMAGIPFHAAARYYQRLMDASAQVSKDLSTRTWTEIMEGLYLAGRGQRDAAQEHLSASAQIADQIGNTRRRSEAQGIFAVNLMLQGKWQESYTLLQALDTENSRRHDNDMQGKVFSFLAVMLIWEGDIEQATGLLRQAYALMEQAADRTTLTNILGLLAQAFVRNGDFENAENYLHQFLTVPGLENPTAFYMLFGYYGAAECALILWETKPLPERRATAQRTLRVIRRLGRIFDCSQPFALLTGGWLAWLEGKPRRAANLGEQAICSAQRLEMPFSEGLAHYHLGRRLPPQDNRRVEHLRQAEAIFERLGAAYDLEHTRGALAQSVAGSLAHQD